MRNVCVNVSTGNSVSRGNVILFAGLTKYFLNFIIIALKTAFKTAKRHSNKPKMERSVCTPVQTNCRRNIPAGYEWENFTR